MEDEYKLLRENVEEFGSTLDEKKIEENGIDNNLLKKLASQGFLAALIPENLGGSGLDESSYNIILEVLSKYSPSSAFEIFLINSIAYPVLSDDLNYLNDVIKGDDFIGISLDKNIKNNSLDSVLNANGKYTIMSSDVPAIAENENFTEKDFMGFKGIRFGNVGIKNQKNIKSNKNIKNSIMNSYRSLAAINLGIISGSLQKALEYSAVRQAFDVHLKDFGPIAFNLSKMVARENILRNIIYSNVNSEYVFDFSIENALEISKYSLNVHGGYGYFKDFGVEKFYRDAMALKAVFYGNDFLENLSKRVYGERSGFI
ncbi:acyl-CoA dehydrogenase family protein [Acidiplasma sp.]|uniref:acyl-CoA dehydrogenase family protein n=1 Tax=Acidiplasma sp. TaxID=1872114 RepID=UPI002590D5CD|nr:acyl-CoA dehydrogenase family protein [Acidiplasma sp.]